MPSHCKCFVDYLLLENGVPGEAEELLPNSFASLGIFQSHRLPRLIRGAVYPCLPLAEPMRQLHRRIDEAGALDMGRFFTEQKSTVIRRPGFDAGGRGLLGAPHRFRPHRHGEVGQSGRNDRLLLTCNRTERSASMPIRVGFGARPMCMGVPLR